MGPKNNQNGSATKEHDTLKKPLQLQLVTEHSNQGSQYTSND